MKKFGILILIVAMVCSAAVVSAEEWQPQRPITLIVPWAASVRQV